MNVKKCVGRGLIGMGLLLMFIGTTSVPSAIAAGVPARCEGSCNKCGTPQPQTVGPPKCIVTVGGAALGTCNQLGAACGSCTGGCEVVQVDGVDKCVCS